MIRGRNCQVSANRQAANRGRYLGLVLRRKESFLHRVTGFNFHHHWWLVDRS